MKGCLFSTGYLLRFLESELEKVTQQLRSLTPVKEKDEGKAFFKLELYTLTRDYVRILFSFIFASYSKRIRVMS